MRAPHLAGTLVLTLAALACDPAPPVKTASGLRIDSVSIEERFPVNPDVKETSLSGDALRKAVAIMDRLAIVDLAGQTFASKDTVDSGSVSIVIRPLGQADRRVTVKSCSHEKICAFFDEAAAQGLVGHKPIVCRGNAPPCGK